MSKRTPQQRSALPTISDKRVRAVFNDLLGDGWQFVRLSGSKHPILEWPAAVAANDMIENERGTHTGSQPVPAPASGRPGHRKNRITLPLTPSDHRALLNVLSEARHISGIDHRRRS